MQQWRTARKTRKNGVFTRLSYNLLLTQFFFNSLDSVSLCTVKRTGKYLISDNLVCMWTVFKFFYMHGCFVCRYICVQIMTVVLLEAREREAETLECDIQIILRPCVLAGNKIWILGKSSQCCYLLSQLFSPLYEHFLSWILTIANIICIFNY